MLVWFLPMGHCTLQYSLCQKKRMFKVTSWSITVCSTLFHKADQYLVHVTARFFNFNFCEKILNF